MLGGNEFIDNLMQKIWQSMYQGIWDGIHEIWNWMQGIQAFFFSNSRELIAQSPSGWNERAFLFIKQVVENAAIPVAAVIITFVFCWQLISMIQESNQMHNIKAETIVLLSIKLIICLFVCANAFKIVCGLFDMGAWAAQLVPRNSIIGPENGSLENILPRDNPNGYSFGSCMIMLIYLLITFIALAIEAIIGMLVYVKVNIWFMNLLVYMAAAPIPFATFVNKEWGQIGMNYVRKMLAMSFQGFFMLIVFGLYSAMCSNVLSLDMVGLGNSYFMSMIVTCGCGAGLISLLNQTGSISASVFNAH